MIYGDSDNTMRNIRALNQGVKGGVRTRQIMLNHLNVTLAPNDISKRHVVGGTVKIITFKVPHSFIQVI